MAEPLGTRLSPDADISNLDAELRIMLLAPTDAGDLPAAIVLGREERAGTRANALPGWGLRDLGSHPVFLHFPGPQHKLLSVNLL
jgi:hypothetical protein